MKMAKLAENFAATFSRSRFGLAGAITRGRHSLEDRQLILRNDPPFNFYTCSTSIRLLIDQARAQGVADEDLRVAALTFPVEGEFASPHIKELAHVVALGREGNKVYFFGQTPFDQLVFGLPSAGDFLRNDHAVDDYRRFVVEDRLPLPQAHADLDRPEAFRLSSVSDQPGKLKTINHMLGAQLTGSLLSLAYLGLTFGPDKELILTYLADCLEWDKGARTFVRLGEQGFLAGLDRDLAVKMGAKLKGNGQFLPFLMWLANPADRPKTFVAMWEADNRRYSVEAILQRVLTEHLPVLAHFISHLPPEIFGSQRLA
jgi:hypothetical protein